MVPCYKVEQMRDHSRTQIHRGWHFHLSNVTSALLVQGQLQCFLTLLSLIVSLDDFSQCILGIITWGR